MAEDFVKKRLKAPSTASFPSMMEDGVKVLWSGDCNFRVFGYVDAQNGFGAQIRSKFDAKLHYTPGDEYWHLDDVNFE